MYIKNFSHKDLFIEELAISPDQAWCIYGENNSGIDRLVELFSGKLEEFTAEDIVFPTQPGILSFQAQQEIYEEELYNDDTDFMDKLDPGTLVCDFFPDDQTIYPLLKAMSMEHCLRLGYRQLSSGQK